MRAAVVLSSVVILATIAVGSITPRAADEAPRDVAPCKQVFHAPEVVAPYQGAVCNSPDRTAASYPVTEGRMPLWLRGTLYRNVIGQFTFGNDQMRHFFDGMSQLMSVRFDPDANAIVLKSKMQNTTDYQTCVETQSFPYVGFATPPNPGPMNFTAKQPCNSNGNFVLNNDVNIVRFGGRFFTTTDANGMVEFDGETLDVATPNVFQFNDTLTGQAAVAHGPMDQTTSEYFNLIQNVMPLYFGGKCNTSFWKVTANAASNQPIKREVVGWVLTDYIPYSHSFGITENYIVWIEQPLRMNKTQLQHFSAFLYALEDVSATMGQTFHVIDRKTGVHRSVPVDANDFGGHCYFHTGNVYEDSDGSIVYDTALQTQCNAYDWFEFTTFLTSKFEDVTKNANGYLTRFRWYPHEATARVGRLAKFEKALFPWYNKQFHMRPYRYAYMTALFIDDARQGQITKVDTLANATVAIFKPKDRVLTEALFIARDTSGSATDEEDGLLVTVAFDIRRNVSEIIALDPRDLAPQFVVRLPFGIPLHLHGIYCTANNTYCLWN